MSDDSSRFPPPGAPPPPDDSWPPPGSPPATGPPRGDSPAPGHGAPPTPSYGPPAPPGYGGPPPPGYGAPPPGYGAPPPPGYGGPPPGQGGYGGWSPYPAAAPRPGVVPLRPLGLGDIFDGAIKTIRANPQATLGLGFLVGAIFLIPSVLVALWLQQRTTVTGSTDQELTALAIETLPTIASGLGGLLLSGFIVYVVSQAVLGAKAGIGQTWRETRARLLPLIGVNILTYLIVVAVFFVIIFIPIVIMAAAGATAEAAQTAAVPLMLLGLIVVVWFVVRLSMAGPATVLERLGVGASLGRSWRLTSGSPFWRILGITLLAALVAGVVALVLSIPVGVVLTEVDPSGTSALSTAVLNLVQLVVGAVTTPFTAGVACLLYLDQRIRREALDVTLARAVQQG